nr:S-layer family protein [uncultured Haemophilus sp.]
MGVDTKTEDVEEIALESKPTERYRVGVDGYYNWSGRNAWFRFYDTSKPPLFEKQFYVWKYKRTTNTPYIKTQDKAQLNIGGNLHLEGDDLHNKYSQVAVGGTLFVGDQAFNSREQFLNATNAVLRNEDIDKIVTVDENGEAQFLKHYKRHGHNGHKHEKISDFSRSYNTKSSFNTADVIIGTPLSTPNVKVEDRPLVKDITLDTLSINTTNNVTDIRLTPEIDAQSQDQVIGSGQVFGKLETSIDNFDPSKVSELKMPLVRTHLENVRLPEASLYKINPDAPSGFVVETDPRFTNKRQWLSSDYMFNALRYNHDNVHKRLGDGFYEQRLVNEQVHQLTGRRFIEGYQNDLEQYKALMNSGVKYAKALNLSVGVGLTAKQMSELTTDMVWLVNKEVTLADGRKITALVPQVYLVARDSDITSHGAVISANQIQA